MGPQDRDIELALARVTAALPGGGEPRPGQVAMALAVGRALRDRRHLVVQAGTGTGKSLAYLVPALLSGKKTVVATATKALQDQLGRRDLPFLAQHLGRPISFAVLKGRSNYVCVQKANEAITAGEQLDLADDAGQERTGPASRLGAQVVRLVEWSRTSPTGDRADLDFEPAPAAWAAVSLPATDCPGALKCPSGEDCLAEGARRRAAEADVVVVNTHLYGAHLASGGAYLPEHDLVVFDEAHELEDVAASSLGLELGPGRLRALARNARALAGAPSAAIIDAADAIDRAISPRRGQRLPAGLDEELSGALAVAAERVRALTSALRDAPDADPAKARCLQAAGHLSADIAVVAALDEERVAWVEGGGQPVIKVAPIEVGPLMSDALWGEVTAVLTSATIPPRAVERLGLPPEDTDELDVGSPFPYEAHGLLYCATHLPDPRAPGADAAIHDELVALIKAAGGRTLALFTSWRAMERAAEAVRGRVDYRVLLQSDLPKPALVEAFSGEETSCLFATVGFWQGVDVPGRTLSLVTLDRLPFPRPDEPLFQARRDKAGPDAFRTVDIPRAATLLARGAGRLIRSSEDRGVVAVLDPRLATASYRWELVRALPPMRRTRHRAEVEAFLAEVTGAAPPGTAAAVRSELAAAAGGAGGGGPAAARAALEQLRSRGAPEPGPAAASPGPP
ncbi:MAG TPA: ATP-dependent DNA helicase [Acidimicrobiales bacterium]|nr:ATP-dependent DNA helicase [Acidimicrobiales bacterium]